MNLTVVGAGFVGLVTAAVFADFKNQVWVVDHNDDKIKNLSSGKIPFYEPGLEKLIIKNLKARRLHFTDNYVQGMTGTEIIFICVGTPNKDGQVDLTSVKAAAKSVAENLKKPAIVVIKSTVPPGINKELEKVIKGQLQQGIAVRKTDELYKTVSLVNKILEIARSGGKKI